MEINLKNSIKEYQNRVRSFDKDNLLLNSICKMVIGNFAKLENLIYNYINFYFDKMTYEYNLYSYNYFIETCKVNIELLSKATTPDEVIY